MDGTATIPLIGYLPNFNLWRFAGHITNSNIIFANIKFDIDDPNTITSATYGSIVVQEKVTGMPTQFITCTTTDESQFPDVVEGAILIAYDA